MVDSRSLFYPVPRFNPSPTVSNFIDLAGITSVKISTAEFGLKRDHKKFRNRTAYQPPIAAFSLFANLSRNSKVLPFVYGRTFQLRTSNGSSSSGVLQIGIVVSLRA